MFEIRVIILRMRRGDSDRCLAKAGLIGRRKAGELRELAQRQGWLDPSTPVPDNATLAKRLGEEDKKPAHQRSLVEPYHEHVQGWVNQGIQGSTIHQAL